MGKSRFDTTLTVIVVVLIVAAVGFAAFFGYTIYRDKKMADESSPSMRVVRSVQVEVKKHPNDAALRVRLGEALAAAGKSQEAIEQFNAALKIDPKHTGAYVDLGLLALHLKRSSQAEAYFKKVVELTNGQDYENVNTRRETAFYNLGLIQLEAKRYEEAIGSFKASLRIRRDASDSYYYLARALYLNGDVEGAIKNALSAVAFDPSFAPAHYFLGEVYLSKNDRVSASYEYHKAAALQPDAPEPKQALRQFGTSAQLIATARSKESSDLDAAIDAVMIARNIDPGNKAVALLAGDLFAKRKDWKNALNAYQQAAKLDPKNKQIQSTIKTISAKVPKTAKS